jgi:hypothetical protein
VQREISRPRRHAPGAATSRSHLPASPAPLARARGLTRVAPSIDPTWGEHRHRQRPPPPRGPRRAGSPDEPARALGKGRRGRAPATSAAATPSCCGPVTAAVTRNSSPVIVALAAAASACCGPVTTVVMRNGSPVAAALATVHGTLAERRPIVAGTLDLSTLAGARVGTIGVTLSTRKQNSKRQPLEIKGVQGEMLLTSSWRNPASSSSRTEGVSPSRPLAPPPMARRRALLRPPRVPIP